VNFLLVLEILYLAATLSTYGVGSTPGNNTKNNGTLGLDSLKVSNILKGGCSIYLSSIIYPTKLLRAEGTLSGLMAL
jgi:hypothetical protein